MPELHRENLQKQPTLNTEEKNLEVKKSIEIEEDLIKESGLPAEEWIEGYGGHFREIIKKNPKLLNNVDEIREKLYKKTTH
jgi:hypothetical protein